MGQAVKGAELAIIGADGQPCKEGEEGEVWAAGPMVFQVGVSGRVQCVCVKEGEEFAD